MKNITIIVPARAGSVGVKNKNLRKIKGRSLIQRAVDLGLRGNFKVIVTTDIPKPLPVEYKGLVTIYKRPEHLSSHTANMDSVILDLIKTIKLQGTIILLQPTSPLRTYRQLMEILELYVSSSCTLCISGSREDNNILKNYIKLNDKYEPISSNKYLFSNRQDLPLVFHPNGAFYVFDADDFCLNGFNTSNVVIYEMDSVSSLDIDTKTDLRKVRKYAKS